MRKEIRSKGAQKISIIIPTWNEAGNITGVIKGIKQTMKRYNYEIIVVDRRSEDHTDQIARKVGARVIYDDVGKGSALINGFSKSKGDILISMDADMSNRPNELLLLTAGIEAGYDLCIGSRFLSGGGSSDMPIYRKIGNKFFVALVNLVYGSKYTDMCYGYRSISKSAFVRLRLTEKGFGIETEINIRAKKANMRVLEIPSFEKGREKGDGKLKSWRDGYIILKTIIKNIN